MAKAKVITDHDKLTLVTMLLSGRDLEFAAAALGLPEGEAAMIAVSHGHPSEERLQRAKARLTEEIRVAEGGPPVKARSAGSVGGLEVGRRVAASVRDMSLGRPQRPPEPRKPAALPTPDPTPERQAGAQRVLEARVLRLALLDFHPSNVGRDLGDLRSLAGSINDNGILVPLDVETTTGGRYRLRDGHRRLAAARLAGIKTGPAIIHTDTLDEREWLLQSVEFNHRRKGYDEADQRRVASRLEALGVTRAGIAEAFGVSPNAIGRLLVTRKNESHGPRTPVKRGPSHKALCDFLDHCAREGYNTDVQTMLAALLAGLPWRTVDEAREALDAAAGLTEGEAS